MSNADITMLFIVFLVLSCSVICHFHSSTDELSPVSRKRGTGTAVTWRRWFWAEWSVREMRWLWPTVSIILSSAAKERERSSPLVSFAQMVSDMEVCKDKFVCMCFKRKVIPSYNWIKTIHFPFSHNPYSGFGPGAERSTGGAERLHRGPTLALAVLCSRGKLPRQISRSSPLAIRPPSPATLLLPDTQHRQGWLQTPARPPLMGVARMP